MRHPFDPQESWQLEDTQPRRERLAELARSGWPVPRNGPWSLLRHMGVPLVLYLNETTHCGHGKALWQPGDPPPTIRETWCSEWAGDRDWEPGNAVYSRRYLTVGYYKFNLEYTSQASWMSNVDGEYRLIDWRPPLADRNADLLRYPIYAVDVVYRPHNWDDPDLAVDLNVCPGIPMEAFNLVGRDTLKDSYLDFVMREARR